MLEINLSDVINVIQQIRPYLIGFGVVLLLAVIVMIAVRKAERAKRKLIRAEAGISIVLALLIVVNLICTGPMHTLLSLVSGEGAIEEETSEMVNRQAQQIAEEGIVLLKNEENLLPTASKRLNVFGWASTNPCYGGTGSGRMNDQYPIVDLLSGLQNAGFETNEELSEFYTEYRAERPEVGMWEQDWTLPEPAADTYPEELLTQAKEFSDVAVVVLSRVGGEHIDLPRDVSAVNYTDNSKDYEDFPEGTHYLEPSTSEKNMIDMVCENFEDVILVYNGANTMELGWTEDYGQIKSVLWCPGTGQNGFNALGRILNGEVNPSGKTADTFAADLTSTPTWNTFASFEYDNMEEFRISEEDAYMPDNLPHFINYSEGIYVGYKFYETAAAEGLIDYEDAVTYPFGYGLSYTEFEQEMGELKVEDGFVSFDVTVTNTGQTAGKDVVEVYYEPPYTDGGIEKASANLAAFDKTKELAPGESQTLGIRFAVEDMAAYDTYGFGSYVLEAGDYEISINSDSHTKIDSQVYTAEETVVYGEENKRATDVKAAENAFDFAEGDVTYLSRADGFANYEEAAAAPESLSMSEEAKAGFTNNSNWSPDKDEDVEMPVTDAKNGVTVTDVRGLDYDDPKWEELLDNLTIDEMVNMIGLGGYQTAAADSIGKVQTTDCDGPAAINNNFTRVGSIGYPCGVMIANTWNEEIAYMFGDGIGQMAEEMNVAGWYAPAMNMHRNAFTGRNFEYYSEDGLLSGKIASQAVQGAWSHGVYAYIKHFALNEMEENRWGMLCTWANEQSIREIYLKPFEICVKEADAMAVMSSYNYIGNQWAGSCSALLNTVLRDEWGFEGMVLTDYFASFGYMDATRAIYNGGDSCLINMPVETNFVTDTENPATVAQMRRACHNILYTTVNSRAHAEENLNSGILLWQVILIAVDVAVIAALLGAEAVVIRKYRKNRADSEKQ